MTREWLGLIALNGVLLAVGTALLAGIGLVRGLGDGARFAGLALVLGWAALGITASYALMLGAQLSVLQILSLALMLVLGGAAAARWVPKLDRPARAFAQRRAENVVALAGAAALVLYLDALFLRARLAEPTRWDTWAFWVPKAMSVVHFDGLDTAVGGFSSFANPDYPPLKPAMDATAFRFLGDVDPGALPLQNWIVVVAFFGAVAGLLAGRVRPAVLWPSLAAVALLPDFGSLVGSVLADESLALLFALAGLCGALWLVDHEVRFAVLAALLLAAAALVKNEGLMLALVLAVMLAAVTRGRRWRPLVPLAVLPIVALIPWRLWLGANNIPESSSVRLEDLTDVELLRERSDRLADALPEMARVVLAFDRWSLTVPLVVAVAAVLVVRRRGLAVYAAGTPVLGFLGFATVYWVSTYPLDWYVATTADRVLASLVVFGATIFPLLVSEALEAGRP